MPALLRLPLTIAELAARQTLALAKWGIEHFTSGGGDDDAAAREARPAAAPPAPSPPRRSPSGNGAARRATATAVPQAPPAPAPPRGEGHVDREAVEVASVGPAADPHATIEVAAPWDDYDRLPASQVIERLRGADAAVKAAVALYEAQHKGRSTVLAATRG